MLDTPVLFLIFNRPDLTERVFKNIREAMPSKLFIAADGPRKENPGDIGLCNEAINMVLNNIDWHCEVKTLFRENNLGCRIAVSEAITWFFQHVEQGIILEDDCLPDLSFFFFCQELLEKFKKDERIFHISGNNFQLSSIGQSSYYFSKLPHIWGWATWRRAWRCFDVSLEDYIEEINHDYFNNAEIDLFWKNHFSRVKNQSVDEWDYQWVYTLFKNDGYAILPQLNLVKNIGFDERGLRTNSSTDFLADLKTYPIETIIHPDKFVYNATTDINFQKLFGWYSPVYENRMSGSESVKLVGRILQKRILHR